MKLADVLTALRRRWYVVLAGILAAAGAAFFTWGAVSPQYERVGTQLLLPGLATIPEDANPYLYVGGLYQIADVIVRAIGAEDISEVTDEYPGTEVLVGRDQSAGAVVTVTVTATSDEAADEVLDDMLAVTERTLDELQDEQSIPDDQRVSLTPLTQAAESTVIQKTRMLTTALVGGVLLVGGVGAAVLIDSLLRARRRPHRSNASAAVTLGAIPTELDEDAEAARSEPARRLSADSAPASTMDAADDAERDAGDTAVDANGPAEAEADAAGAPVVAEVTAAVGPADLADAADDTADVGRADLADAADGRADVDAADDTADVDAEDLVDPADGADAQEHADVVVDEANESAESESPRAAAVRPARSAKGRRLVGGRRSR
jgi:capsular polysaccharide biosynthesis protein